MEGSRVIQSVSGQTRCFSVHWKRSGVTPLRRIILLICYIVEYVGVLLNRFEVGVDGRDCVRAE